MMEENIIRYIELPDKNLFKELDEESASKSLEKMEFIMHRPTICGCKPTMNFRDLMVM